jgi:hypothetical protein
MTGDLMNFTPSTGLVLDLVEVNIWDGKWHHIAAVYDDINWIDFYVDGVLAGHHWARPWDWVGTIGTNNYDIFIGANSGEIQGGGSYGDVLTGWKGRIDDVRIYDSSLTPNEISIVMYGGMPPVPPEPWPPDLNGDLIINFLDYAILADGWLEDETFPFK